MFSYGKLNVLDSDGGGSIIILPGNLNILAIAPIRNSIVFDWLSIA